MGASPRTLRAVRTMLNTFGVLLDEDQTLDLDLEMRAQN
jgi:hypothetical protein